MSPETLRAVVDDGWNRHAGAPQAVAETLAARAATLAGDPAAADAIGLAEHVWLAHLHDPAGLTRFLDALGAASPALLRARWTLEAATGRPAHLLPEIAPALRWRALQNLWALQVHRGQAADARQALAAELPLALAHEDAATRRALAATCNNLAVELRLGMRGDAARDALMLDVAAASRELWTGCGTWVHVERADYQLAHCHAVLGQGGLALQHARACLAAIDAHAGAPEADAFECFFAHEALAVALRASADAAAVQAERARMVALLEQIADAGLRAWAGEALAALDGG